MPNMHCNDLAKMVGNSTFATAIEAANIGTIRHVTVRSLVACCFSRSWSFHWRREGLIAVMSLSSSAICGQSFDLAASIS